MCRAASLLNAHTFRFAAFSLLALSTPAVCARRGSCARNWVHSDASVANCCLSTCSKTACSAAWGCLTHCSVQHAQLSAHVQPSIPGWPAGVVHASACYIFRLKLSSRQAWVFQLLPWHPCLPCSSQSPAHTPGHACPAASPGRCTKYRKRQ